MLVFCMKVREIDVGSVGDSGFVLTNVKFYVEAVLL
jgi:hypothetical protein